jgi:hypothetical protein
MGFFRCKHHHTKFTKKSKKTRKINNWLDGTQVVSSPVPHAKFSKINEMHEKADRGGGMGKFFLISGCGGDCGLPRRGGLSGANL